jgi:hypothetical protein
MRRKPEDPKRTKGEPELDSDTASYEQLQGETRRRPGASTGNPKMPHERDESARGMGNRLNETLPPSKREVSQAHEDTERGLVDTERRGIPNDIPGKVRRER